MNDYPHSSLSIVLHAFKEVRLTSVFNASLENHFIELHAGICQTIVVVDTNNVAESNSTVLELFEFDCSFYKHDHENRSSSLESSPSASASLKAFV